MDERINKSPSGHDIETDGRRQADSADSAKPGANPIDCGEDNYLDIIFEFETPENGSH